MYIGFDYSDCALPIWSTLTTTMRGFDMEVSELGTWNVDMHHRYNFHQAVLQRGDGSVIYLKQQPRVASVLMGASAQPRPLMCTVQECDGPARPARLLSPISLSTGPDGSVYVGDANLVRRVTPDGYVYTVFKKSDKSSSAKQVKATSGHNYNYHILISPYDGHMYISDPERHQILRVHSVDRVEYPESNYDVLVGSGARCLPRDPSRCGDDGSALDARLSFPKGMAFGLDGTLYFADGHAIRLVNMHGIITTLIGGNHEAHSRKSSAQWKPVPCGQSLAVEQLKLRWPSELHVHPIDGSLHFLDDQMVFKMTQDHRVLVAVGRPSYCPSTADDLGLVISFSFAANGDMLVASMDKHGTNMVTLIDQQQRHVHFMGGQGERSSSSSRSVMAVTRCDVETCKEMSGGNCTCAVSVTSGQGKNVSSDLPLQLGPAGHSPRLARDTPLESISSIAVGPDGAVHVADEGTFQIISAIPFIPGPDEQLQFSMHATGTDLVYVFNKYGQQIFTRSATTGLNMYSFLYDVNTSFGKLSAVQDSSGSKVSFLRDSAKSLYSIETSAGYACRVTVNNQGQLEVFVDQEGLSTKFYYEPDSGLLKRRSDSSGFSLFYEYDGTGRLTGVI